MTTTTDPTCADRIGAELADRQAQIKAMQTQAEGTEYYGDEEAIYELALGITKQEVVTVCLSTGGPADYLEIFHTAGDISKMVYRFSDWFDTATREVERGSALWSYGEMIIEVGE